MSKICNRRVVPVFTVVDGHPDAELFALDVAIRRLNDAAQQIYTKRIEPFDAEYHALALFHRQAAREFTERTGREEAISEMTAELARADGLFRRLQAIPAVTKAGQAAKVRALLVHVMRDDWRGPSADLDWSAEQARELLGEFTGMSAEELAAI